VALLALALVVGVGPASQTAPAAAPLVQRLDEQPASATLFQVGSFNVLGAGHTGPNGNKPQFASGKRRMVWATRIIDEGGLDVVGFQEFERPQFEKFKELRGSRFGIYPGDRFDGPAMSNSIAWKLSEWKLVQARTILVPYFHGKMLRKPVLLLENLHTGQQAYFFNTHNPANARGPAQRWRNKAVRIEINLANQLRTEAPGIPVFFTGDMNDKERFFCPITEETELHAADGGTNIDGVCTPPVPSRIDWILGTPEVTFTGYTARNGDALVEKTTDHPVVMATASIPPLPVQDTTIRRVVLLDVEGLSSTAVRRAGATRAPNLYRMMAEGASTLNARSATERTTSLPNVVGMLTGRRVTANRGGHGVRSNVDNGTTVRSAAGRYVSSTYDLIHNFGLRTALFSSKPNLALVARSWDSSNGGADPFGLDDGRGKITRVVRTTDDAGLSLRLNRMLRQAPKAFTLAHFSMLADTGRDRGWLRPRYFRALTQVDSMVGGVLDTIAASPSLSRSTLVLLTADGGGTAKSPADRTLPGNFTIPLVAWGPGVVAGADLYAINPAYDDPGTAQVGYAGAQPIRNATVANLVTAILHLPAIPGSQLNTRQDFNIFVGPTG
jgi:hypothetical protein